MTIVVLLVLAVIWAAVLVPPYLEKRRAVHPTTSIGHFRHQLAVLQRTGDPTMPLPSRPTPARPMARDDVLRRRRDVFTTLASAAGLTFVLALLLGGSLWLLHLTVDAALLGYTAMLLQIQQQSMARRRPARPSYAADPSYAGGPAARSASWAMSSDNVSYLPRSESATQQALLRRPAN